MSTDKKSSTNRDDYKPVDLARVCPDKELGADVYLLIDSKFLKFKSKGDPIPAEKYGFFVSKSLSQVYVRNDEYESFNSWLNQAKEELLKKFASEIGEENLPVAQAQVQLQADIIETFLGQELNSYNVEKLQTSVKKFVEEFSQNHLVTEFMAKLIKFNGTFAEHSTNVANIAIYVALLNGICDKDEIELLYQAAIFHDYGKLKIPSSRLENTNSPTYILAINDHPIKGAEYLKKLSGINQGMIRLVEEHHEQFNGAGYPNKKSSDDLHVMSSYLSMANVYDNEFQKAKAPNDIERHRKAIKVIEYDRGKFFNPNYVQRAVEGLKLAFGNYQK
jgi:putative nucleotidyltransferase with HDIG domain